MKIVTVAVVLLAAACSHAPPVPVPLKPGCIEVIDASPADGFNFPYVLRIPAAAVQDRTYLLVEPNNTGRISDDLNVHLEGAKKLSGTGVGAFVAKQLDLPLLMPVFPRPEADWKIYTHLFDRDTMLIEDGPLRRVDLQLLAMVRNARARLRANGIPTHEKFLLTGFSASGSFSNRFTMIHPQRVKAVAGGGLNALVMLPLATLDGEKLPYPIGTADLRQLTGRAFNEKAWRQVPQLYYMGAQDDNDAVLFGDGYEESERQLIFKVLGETMQPDRWTKGQMIYGRSGANAKFATYLNIGHGTDLRINDDVTAFFREVIAKK